METTNDATRLLEAWRQGVAGASDALFALVYDDLRTLARRAARAAQCRPTEAAR
jgi:hypothetical protein